MNIVIDEPVFIEPWQDLRGHDHDAEHQRRTMHNQLNRELSPCHPLHGHTITVIARSQQRDDIVITTAESRWAIVHLTWKQAPDTPPWPVTTFYDNADDLTAKLNEDTLD